MGFNLVVFIVKEIAVFATAFFLVLNVYHVLEMRNMTETIGVVTRREPFEVVVEQGTRWERKETRFRVFVAYTVGGEQYEISWPVLVGHSGLVGQQVRFFYDSADPLRIRTTEDRFAWVTQIILGFTGLIFFIGFMGLSCKTEADSPWLPYIIIRTLELGGAGFAIWQWISPVTNTFLMLMGVLVAGAGIAASSAASFKPMLLSGFMPEKTLEKTLLAQLVSIKSEGGQYTLLFRDKQGKTYSFLTSGIPDLEENSVCTLTVKGGTVQRFVPLSPRRFD